MKFRYASIFVLLLLFTACSKQLDGDGGVKRGSVILNILPKVKDVPAVVTKSTQPMKDASIGLFACDHFVGSGNPYVSYGNGMNNIKATLTTDKYSVRNWQFRLSTVDSVYPSLILTSKRDGGNKVLADMYAYLPYDENITSPEVVPFIVGLDDITTLSSNQQTNYFRDVMYAEENASPTANKALDPEAVDEFGVKLETVDVTFTFKHALSLIKIEMEIQNDKYNHPDGDGNTSYCLDKVIIRKGVNGHLYRGATMNAITGALSDMVPADSLVVAREFLNGTKRGGSMPYSTIIPTQPGEDYVDDDYKFSFVLDGVEIASKFYLKREQLRHYDAEGNPTEVFGFLPGYIYTFKFKYDNFVRLEGISIAEWEVVEEPLYEIEI